MTKIHSQNSLELDEGLILLYISYKKRIEIKNTNPDTKYSLSKDTFHTPFPDLHFKKVHL